MGTDFDSASRPRKSLSSADADSAGLVVDVVLASSSGEVNSVADAAPAVGVSRPVADHRRPGSRLAIISLTEHPFAKTTLPALGTRPPKMKAHEQARASPTENNEPGDGNIGLSAPRKPPS